MNNQTCQKYSGIGGQAILEGIMMKNRQNYACAARKPDGSIALDVQKYVSLPEKYPVLALPLIRGVFSFVDSMVLGMRSLNWSAEIYAEETGDRTKTVIASTASPYKFAAAVVRAIDPARAEGKDEFELIDELRAISGTPEPAAITDIRTAPVRHETVADVEEMPATVLGFLGIRA